MQVNPVNVNFRGSRDDFNEKIRQKQSYTYQETPSAAQQLAYSSEKKTNWKKPALYTLAGTAASLGLLAWGHKKGKLAAPEGSTGIISKIRNGLDSVGGWTAKKYDASVSWCKGLFNKKDKAAGDETVNTGREKVTGDGTKVTPGDETVNTGKEKVPGDGTKVTPGDETVNTGKEKVPGDEIVQDPNAIDS